MTATNIANCLGTTYQAQAPFFVDYGRRLFSTILSACGSATGDLPMATGTLPGVQQVGNAQIKKTAFLGFANLCYAGSTQNGWTYRVHQDWLDGNDYDTPLRTAVNNANAAYPEVVGWGPTIFGDRFLDYNAYESR